ncbi:hypothetical protein [Blastopirellula marina]|uniref:Uncharacterized protein n=1 Tax=Blastopirellula marina TaxID=124 RepID=A0A2S8F3W0_9BACT|nr:hypothetical protein [Blastopirellula marina]PQO26841.1 hypothetical protein C5Y98_29150 [Blastopirellula marina]PTL41048.1 hypothetical protein C5Y97_29165 [Blastopirellula marina]
MRRIAFVTICCIAFGCERVAESPPEPSPAPDTVLATEEQASAGMSLEHFYSGSSPAMIAAEFPHDLVITGEVTSVSDTPATNEKPPVATVRVDRILAGESSKKEIRVVWEPFPHDVDWGVPEKEPRYLAWAKTPLAAPKIGEQFVLLLSAQEGRYSCASIARFSLTPENVKQVENGLSKRDEPKQ